MCDSRLLCALAFVAGVVSLSAGCRAPGYSVEKDILHEGKFAIEPKVGVYVPLEDDFDAGLAGGFKASYEFHHNVYISLDFTYASVEGDDGDFPAAPPLTAGDMRGFDSEVLSRSDRVALLLGLDFDIPLVDDDDSYVPYFRVGLAPGVLFTRNSTDASLKANFAAQDPPFDVEIQDDAFFMLRPNAGIRFPFGPDFSLFADASFDWVPGFTDVRVKLNGTNVSSDEVNFNGFNFLFGLSAKF